ncbi:13786_t:CDS:2 [Funneliformis geosporum]|uniref:1366_t:CDS:1 n=1 Tax=Funneliformis geosporum TaxID=1117311 RepID=A0A9W4X1W2_9GLOM|nr:1366_t:CDS:2 [Funneliformis geosporum]CAI2189458.1 13786_t:CDS:2 [Funneliformis geosporum]
MIKNTTISSSQFNFREEEVQNFTRPDGANIVCNAETVLSRNNYKKPSKYFLKLLEYTSMIAIPILLLYFTSIRFTILGIVIMAIFQGILLYRDYLRQYFSDI